MDMILHRRDPYGSLSSDRLALSNGRDPAQKEYAHLVYKSISASPSPLGLINYFPLLGLGGGTGKESGSLKTVHDVCCVLAA